MPKLSELRTIVRRDPLLTSQVINDGDLNDLINEGSKDFALVGDAFIVSASWSAVASTATYVLSGGASPKVSNFLSIYDPIGLIYTQSSGSTKVAPTDFTWVSEKWLALHLPTYKDTAASDTLQHLYLTYDTSGYLNLGVYPKSSTTTPSFLLFFRSGGAAMSSDDNYPWVNATSELAHTAPYSKALAYYAMWQLHDMRTHQNALAQKYQQRYLELAVAMREAQRAVLLAEIQGLRDAGMLVSGQVFGSG